MTLNKMFPCSKVGNRRYEGTGKDIYFLYLNTGYTENRVPEFCNWKLFKTNMFNILLATVLLTHLCMSSWYRMVHTESSSLYEIMAEILKKRLGVSSTE